MAQRTTANAARLRAVPALASPFAAALAPADALEAAAAPARPWPRVAPATLGTPAADRCRTQRMLLHSALNLSGAASCINGATRQAHHGAWSMDDYQRLDIMQAYTCTAGALIRASKSCVAGFLCQVSRAHSSHLCREAVVQAGGAHKAAGAVEWRPLGQRQERELVILLCGGLGGPVVAALEQHRVAVLATANTSL